MNKGVRYAVIVTAFERLFIWNQEMHAKVEVLQQTDTSADVPAIVIVGAGPVGIRVAEELMRRMGNVPLVIYGDEPWKPYDRAALSSFLAGELDLSQLYKPMRDDMDMFVQRYHCRIASIDPINKVVVDEYSHRQAYHTLVLATGSRSHVPNIEGIDKSGIFTFRDLDDAQHLIARRARSQHTLVVGGGLLGLEAARAMRRAGTAVTVIDHSPRLLATQLDGVAAVIVEEHIRQQGIDVVLSDGIRRIEGGNAVEAVVLHSGRTLKCDTIVLSAGIRPNIELARDARIAVGRGITVDDNMHTSVDDIYAVGECAEHRGKVYGLVAPGMEQAAVAAHTIAGGQSQYSGSMVSARLKVTQLPVFSIGLTGEDRLQNESSVVYSDVQSGTYRKLVLRRHRLAGAIAIGGWDAIPRIQEAVTRQRIVWPWQRSRFRRYGNLWMEADATSIAQWPPDTVVCNCTGVTRGVLDKAIAAGCCSVPLLIDNTRAASVCGSCKPLLSELIGTPVATEPLPLRFPLLVFALLSVAIAIAISLASAVPAVQSVEAGWHVSQLWLDGFWKQLSGYSIAVLTLLGLFVSARKRISTIKWGSYAAARLLHAVLALVALSLLFVHTGLSMGTNLNFALMTNFLVLAVIGGISAVIIVSEKNLGVGTGKVMRKWWSRMHIVAAWPIPVLLIMHIVSVYYF